MTLFKLSVYILLAFYVIEIAAIITAACTILPVRPWPDWAQGTVFAMLFGPLLVWVFPNAPWHSDKAYWGN